MNAIHCEKSTLHTYKCFMLFSQVSTCPECQTVEKLKTVVPELKPIYVSITHHYCIIHTSSCGRMGLCGIGLPVNKYGTWERVKMWVGL